MNYSQESDTNLTCDDEGQPPSSPQSAGTTEEAAPRAVNVPMVCCALLASMTTGGATYAFGLYGGTLKKNLHLTQSQLDTISTATFFAGLLSWLPGIFIDRFGTRVGISLGGLFGSCALMLYWVVSKGMVDLPNTGSIVSALSALGVATFLSCALITGSVFKIISCNCGAGTKGAAVGVAKGYVGLGAGIYTCLFHSIRQPGSSDLEYLPMAAILFMSAASTPSLFLLPSGKSDRKVEDVLTPLHFRILYSGLVALAGIVIFTSLNELRESHEEKRTSTPNYFLAAVILLLWTGSVGAQLFLPYNENEFEGVEDEEEQEVLLQVSSSSGGPESPNLDPSASSMEEDATIASESNSEISVSDSNKNKNLYEMLQTPEAWLMLWTSTILVGAGTVETNNLSQMVESLHYSPDVTSASLALFSVAQALGRVVTGSVSEAALNWKGNEWTGYEGVPRPFFLVAASVLGIVAHAMLALSVHESMFVFGVTLSGCSFGMVWPMMVLIVGDLFGTAHVGANYLFFDGFTSAGGTLLLSKVVAQHVYERHAEHDSNDDSGNEVCYGQACFETTHLVISVLSATCVVSSVLMLKRTRHAYSRNNASESRID